MADPLVADLGREQLLELYAAMRLTRAAEERLDSLQKQGRVTASIYRSLGQEAGCVGAAYAMRRHDDGTGDVLAPTVRAAGAIFLFGGSLENFFRQYMARLAGPSKGREANLHWVDFPKGFIGPISSLGIMVEIMAGVTLSFRLRGEDRVGLVFYGDGATSTGAWHEGLNFAAVHKCPLILMVEANQFAYSTPTVKNSLVESFTDKGPGYGIATESVDGTDVVAVYEATCRAAIRARAGNGTQLVELRYFRRLGHAQHDAQAYVDSALIEEWARRDPIDLFHARMIQNGWATEAELLGVTRDAEERCRVAAQLALGEAVPDGPTAVDDVFTDVRLPHPWTRAENPDPRVA